MDLKKLRKRMRGNKYFDLRNIHMKNDRVREYFDYYPTGDKHEKRT